MADKDVFPTIEQSLKMIEEKLENQRKEKKNNKSIAKKANTLKGNKTEDSSLLNLFKKNKENKEIEIKLKKKDNVLLLTKKIDDKGKIVDLKKIKVKTKDNTEKKQDKEIDLNIKDHKNLNKTTDLAIIIKKLKKIRDKKINNNKRKISKKIDTEIKKLNETIDLAEDLFKKELLDL